MLKSYKITCIQPIENYKELPDSSVSIQKELIYLYKSIYNLNIIFVNSYSQSYYDKNTLPHLYYDDIRVEKSQIPIFLDKLTNNTNINLSNTNSNTNTIVNTNLSKSDRIILSKLLYTDLDLLLKYYIIDKSRSYTFKQIITCIFQPYAYYKRHNLYNKEFINMVNIKYNISSSTDIVDKIKEIVIRIESYLLRNYENSSYNLNDYFLLSINAAYSCLKRVLDIKIASDLFGNNNNNIKKLIELDEFIKKYLIENNSDKFINEDKIVKSKDISKYFADK